MGQTKENMKMLEPYRGLQLCKTGVREQVEVFLIRGNTWDQLFKTYTFKKPADAKEVIDHHFTEAKK